MIRHIVLWRMKSTSEFDTVRAALRAQLGRVPGLLRIEVGRSFNTGRRAADFVLVCDFASRDALAAYHQHPVHMETRAIVDPLVDEHWIADYEL
jgi:heme-degrading monooxygenase HmoA